MPLLGRLEELGREGESLAGSSAVHDKIALAPDQKYGWPIRYRETSLSRRAVEWVPFTGHDSGPLGTARLAMAKHVSIFSILRDLVSNERIGWIVIGLALTAFIVGMVLAIYTGNYVWLLLSLGAFMFMYAVR